MWDSIARWIIQHRLFLVITLVGFTLFMGYHARNVELSYDFSSTIPPDDPDVLTLQRFKKQFGEDGNIIAIGIRDSALYRIDNFTHYSQLCKQLGELEGVKNVLALPTLLSIKKDAKQKKFVLTRLFPDQIESQHDLDSLLYGFEKNELFYKDRIINPHNGATLAIISIGKEFLFSKKRVALLEALQQLGNKFEANTNIRLNYTGIPFIRTVIAKQVRKEMLIFLYLSIFITGVVMFLFFRSFRIVIVSLAMIGVSVIWVLGSLALFEYKITMLSGLIPPVIVVIGITNFIYLLNKYHVEYAKDRDKENSIFIVVRKMGLATFLTNLTVAISFLSLLSTDIPILRQFGIVAGLNVMGLFTVSVITVPSLLYWLPNPKDRNIKYLRFKKLNRFVERINWLVLHYRSIIYIISLGLAVLSLIGMSFLHSISFVVDDVPDNSQVKKDLRFFETHFSGIMPFEIWVNTRKKRSLLKTKNLRALDTFERTLDSIPNLSKPLSIIDIIKACKQAFYNGNPSYYALPTSMETGFLLRYVKNFSSSSLLSSFTDSTYQYMHISLQMADIGSDKMDSLISNKIEPAINQLIHRSNFEVTITGTTHLFIKGNKFLIANLKESLLIAFLLITLSMAILFAKIRMIVISLIPNLLALMITAGLMGYMNIPLKASTALIFSITFGISIDNAIRFLAKYRQELFAHGFFVPLALTNSILETGKSIIYTSIVLFVGFIIFAFSSFGGTISLGILTSTTIVISMFTNLILLPALILTFDKPRGNNKDLIHPQS